MTSKTVHIPAISCEHCVATIEREVSEMAGVVSVQADEASKNVVIAWNLPASWDEIEALLVEIEYAPE